MPAATTETDARLSRVKDPQQVLAILFGIVLLALGVVDLAGLFQAGDELFGIFEISVGFSIAHIATGLLALVLGLFAGAGALFNKLGGVIYLVVFIIGVVTILAGSTLINWAINWLHLALAVLVGAVGFGIGGRRPR